MSRDCHPKVLDTDGYLADAVKREEERQQDMAGRTPSPEPGACADPACQVLHADPANPIHPPFYEPGGPFVDVPAWAKETDDA